MDLDPERIGDVARSPFAIGAIGALITAVRFMPGAAWPERIFSIFAGSAAAGFVTPALVEWLHMTSAAYASGAAFVCGLLGMSLIAALLQAVKETQLAKIVSERIGVLLSAIFGSRP